MEIFLNIKLVLATLCLGTATASPAFCDAVNFTGNNSTLGHSQTYGSLTAYAFGSNGASLDLYGKKEGGSENGVGISGTSDNEITTSTFVQLDIAKLYGDPFSLTVGSTQKIEGFDVYASNTLGSLGTEIAAFPEPGADPFATPYFSTADRYVSIEADRTSGGNQNVLLDSLTTAATPEPNSLMLFGTGILAAAGVVRRRLAA